MKKIKVLKNRFDGMLVYLYDYTEWNENYWDIIEMEIDDKFDPDVDEINSFIERINNMIQYN